jgi:hypothetical protein
MAFDSFNWCSDFCSLLWVCGFNCLRFDGLLRTFRLDLVCLHVCTLLVLARRVVLAPRLGAPCLGPLPVGAA